MKVPFLDLTELHRELAEDLEAACLRVVRSGWYVLGRELETFEQEFAEFCGAKYCVGVASGLDALFLSLRAYGIGQGDEVIVPAQTFIATWFAVSHSGATPVAVDIDPRHYTIDPERIERAITKRTKAIVPVHLFGHPADLDAIYEIASKNGLKVIEDAAQSHGATYKGRRVGSQGDAVAFSFYPGKNLGALGDGGAIVSNDEGFIREVKRLRNYGSERKYYHKIMGFNSRLDEVQAAFLRVKLKCLERWNQHRMHLANMYLGMLRDSCPPDLVLPVSAPWAGHVWHIFSVMHPKRDRVISELAKKGVECLVHYPVLPEDSECYRKPGGVRENRIARSHAKRCFSLPLHPGMNEAQLEYVVDCLVQVAT
ncbi:MAG: DegT/DnrJ/EryC1/StrS family aminotransferase [Gammaproteobacteria bacterium]|nr:MAG: DegT/DnrJ/EryC1/StrS family aminotransferase [Gammaproteobacteria bacterium]